MFIVLFVDFVFRYFIGKFMFDSRLGVYLIYLFYDVWFGGNVYFVLFLILYLRIIGNICDSECVFIKLRGIIDFFVEDRY